MNLNKRKLGARWNGLERVTERSVERVGRPSILDNQKIERKSPGRLQNIQPETGRTERSTVMRESVRRRPTVATNPFGVRLLEEGVVLAAGLSLILKNGIGHIAGWIRDGREKVSGFGSGPRPWDHEALDARPWDPEEPVEEGDEPIWRGEMETMDAMPVRMIGRAIPRDSFQEEESDDASLESPLRQEVERNKVQKLDAEEDGLPDELLEDQAGALRARLTDASRLG